MKLLVLSLLICGALAADASAKTLHASSWSGKLIVYTTFSVQDERHKPGNDNVQLANADHMMSGRVRHLLLPRKAGQRNSWLGGGGSLDQLKGTVQSSYKDVDAFRTIDVSCGGKIRNNGGESLQFRTMMGFSGALKLVVDGFSLVPKEECSREDFSSPTQIDGWPEDWVFGLPSAPHASKKLELQSDWWRFSSTCGLGEEREGSGAPPGVVREQEGDESCVSGHVVRIHTLLDLKRKCADVKLTYSSSSASEKYFSRRRRRRVGQLHVGALALEVEQRVDADDVAGDARLVALLLAHDAGRGAAALALLAEPAGRGKRHQSLCSSSFFEACGAEGRPKTQSSGQPSIAVGLEKSSRLHSSFGTSEKPSTTSFRAPEKPIIVRNWSDSPPLLRILPPQLTSIVRNASTSL